MRMLYMMNVVADENDHDKFDKIFRKFISELNQEGILIDHGYTSRKLLDYEFVIKGKLNEA